MNATKVLLLYFAPVIAMTFVMSTRALADDCRDSWIDCFGTIAGAAAAATGIGVAVGVGAFGGGVLPMSPGKPEPTFGRPYEPDRWVQGPDPTATDPSGGLEVPDTAGVTRNGTFWDRVRDYFRGVGERRDTIDRYYHREPEEHTEYGHHEGGTAESPAGTSEDAANVSPPPPPPPI